jgi:2-haloacid dehalogenase
VSSYGELAPWPEVNEVLGMLQRHVPLAVVTNCSERLGRIAAARIGVAFDLVVTAEQAGYYKPHPRPYGLALEALGQVPQTVLFVAGSPYDLFGAAAIGMPVFWHNRLRMSAPSGAPAPLAQHDNLYPLLQSVMR